MGFDPVTGIGTGCWPGMRRLATYLFDKFGAGDLGCFNPRSVAGGGPSLHAEGRAQDFAFNAYDDEERARGDALFTWAVLHADEIGLQEMLWRGAIWYWPRRNSEDGWGDFDLPGVYGPVQQADHMSHVHMGLDKHAGMYWEESWLTPDPEPEQPIEPPKEGGMHLFRNRDSNEWYLWDGYNWNPGIPEEVVGDLAFNGVPHSAVGAGTMHWLMVHVGENVEAQIQRIGKAAK